MRILIADAFPDASQTELTDHDHDCVCAPDLRAEELPTRVSGYDVLVVRSTQVTAETIEAADELKMIIRAGSGTNTIDVEAATRRGVHVCNVPGRNAIAVAELAFGLLLALDRQIPDNVEDLRAGHWDKKRYSRARGVAGRRIGVVGLGQIGVEFAERAAAFGAAVHAVSSPTRDARTVERAQAIGTTFVDGLDALARTCDVLSFHVPAGERTRGIIGRRLLSLVPPGAIVLNTSRGDLVDEAALLEAMDTKGVRAGLDVFNGEPGTGKGSIDSPLVGHPNVYGTHHIGASTEQAQQAVADEVVRMVDAFELGAVRHAVNDVPRSTEVRAGAAT